MGSQLGLERDQLEEIRTALRERIRAGLLEDGREIKALPAFFGPPSPTLSGSAIVMDTGGTNMRAALVELESNGHSVVTGPIAERLPVRDEDIDLDRDRFFQIQARLVQKIAPPKGLPVGYCFSYPSEVLPNRDAKLIKWTKGIDIPGVEGTLVGQGLREALDDLGLEPQNVRVLNDTVASMLGGAVTHTGPDRSKVIGLITGTGTNMAGFFSPSNAPKLRVLGATDKMSINLESGNFNPPHLATFDEEVDAASDNPGLQRFEKAVSGYYLPFLFDRIVPNHPGFDPESGSKALVELRDSSEDERARNVAAALLERSADLVGAGLAAVLDFYDGTDEVVILAEGSLFWGDPLYEGRVKQRLVALVQPAREVTIRRMRNANLIGSACAALSA